MVNSQSQNWLSVGRVKGPAVIMADPPVVCGGLYWIMDSNWVAVVMRTPGGTKQTVSSAAEPLWASVLSEMKMSLHAGCSFKSFGPTLGFDHLSVVVCTVAVFTTDLDSS